MILSDFECCSCGNITEHLIDYKVKILPCPKCGRDAKRIISLGQVYTGNQDATWLKSVLDVVDKTNPAKHVQEFVKNPTRANYHRWMKGEGIKPADHTVRGGPPVYERPPDVDMSGVHREVWEKYQRRNALEVRG